jgi:hypothetical protein
MPVNYTTEKRRATRREHREQLAAHAAQFFEAFSDAKPSLQFVARAFNTNVAAIKKAATERQNGNGNGHGRTFNEVVYWWQMVSDAERSEFVRIVGVGSVWRAIEANLK